MRTRAVAVQCSAFDLKKVFFVNLDGLEQIMRTPPICHRARDTRYKRCQDDVLCWKKTIITSNVHGLW